MSPKSDRRNFLKKSISAGVAGIGVPYLIPSRVLASPGKRVGANDKVILGAIGTGSRFGGLSPGNVGGLGSTFASLEGVEFAATADADMGRSQSSATNLGSGVTAYQDYRYILDRSDIDVVIVASPDHWHAQHSIDAAKAGKDIYCEKALTVTVEEGRAMVNAVRKYRRVLQTGSQQRTWDNFQQAIMLIRNGYIGKVNRIIGVNYPGPWENALPAQPVPEGVDWNMWMGPVEPHPYNENIQKSRSNPGWLSIRDFCGGEISGWGAHGLDQIQWALGLDENSGPEEVWVEGKPYEPWIAKSDSPYGRFFGEKDPVIHYTYPGDIHVELSEDSEPTGGATFIGDKGQIKVGRGILEVSDKSWLTVPLEDMKVQVPRPDNHSLNFIDCVRDRTKPTADVEIGHRSATVGHLGNIARWVSEKTGQVGVKMKWDAQAERFTNSEWGNHFLSRPRRAGYSLKS
jgi:predicted dehydrogenase